MWICVPSCAELPGPCCRSRLPPPSACRLQGRRLRKRPRVAREWDSIFTQKDGSGVFHRLARVLPAQKLGTRLTSNIYTSRQIDGTIRKSIFGVDGTVAKHISAVLLAQIINCTNHQLVGKTGGGKSIKERRPNAGNRPSTELRSNTQTAATWA